ncbi:MAG: hypothetical protein IKZ58_01685 [Selenomonadaceae bacterium]|nr:hypothetical protein [Selenomonadaceae bacterium]
MIHVGFAIYDKDGRYSKFTGTAMLSMFENTHAEVIVHLLHDNTLTQDNLDKFAYIAKSYGQTIKFYNVEELCAEEIKNIEELFKNFPQYEKFTIGASYKLLIPQSIPDDIEKIIYLDSDTIINLDVSELWNIDLENKPLAAVAENNLIQDGNYTEYTKNIFYDGIKKIFPMCEYGWVNPEDYFNNGILIFNLKRFHENEKENLSDGIKFLAENFKSQCFDQDIFNYCFSKNYLRLPKKYNVSVMENRATKRRQIENRILHYIHNSLNIDMQDIFNDIWFSYFVKTPWFTKGTIAHLDEGFKQIIDQNQSSSKIFALRMTSIVAGKERAFFASPQIIESVKKAFFVHADEEIILLENHSSFKLLVDSMRNSLSKKIFFIFFFEGYQQLKSFLTDSGFVEERDFINAAIFLSTSNGVQLDTYQLIKAM